MPSLYRGRLVDHIHLRAADLEASRRFYKAVLEAIGRQITHQSDRHFASDELWVDAMDDRPSHVHLAFQAEDREAVNRFHAAGLAAGGKDNGAPGERPYHPGYYGAFLFDPDGNNIEAVYHGEYTSNADAIEISFDAPLPDS